MVDEVALWRAEAGAEWVANAADGCRAALRVEDGPDGPALRFDFALAGQAGWAIARHEVAFEMPEHYVLVLRVRGTGATHELQVKLVDPGGANVWWWRRPELHAGAEPVQLVLRKATLDFAWGPASGGDPHASGPSRSRSRRARTCPGRCGSTSCASCPARRRRATRGQWRCARRADGRGARRRICWPAMPSLGMPLPTIGLHGSSSISARRRSGAA